MGGTDETAVGNLLDLQARIVYKGTTQTAFQVNPDQWTFTLKDYSSEPGVTLNWPSQNASSSPDLDFNLAINTAINPGIDIPPPGTTAQILPTPANAGNLAVVQLTVESHDWGAWATLNVTATVAGQPIQGHLTLPGGQNVTDILLPFRLAGSHIANSWKNAHLIPLNTADSDDSEKSKDGNSNDGDGLTLYEEYRGFYVDCPASVAIAIAGCIGTLQHVEGDPWKKDLFVVNDAWPEVQAGEKLFAAGTGVNVCCPTLRDDQITSDHIINFNHSQGAHLVDQHAVVIAKGNPGTGPCTLGGPAQPKYIQIIFLPSMADVLANAQKEAGAARAVWAGNSYPGKAAHELGHSVNITHHGDGDRIPPHTGYVNWLTLDGLSILESVGGGTPVPLKVFFEDETPVTPQSLNMSIGTPIRVWLGLNNAEHSGDVMCFMRYNVAQQYIANSDPTKRYYVPEREQEGALLTSQTQGTGTNKSTNLPQSRYGDATRGNCSRQLCVNDLIPLPQPPAPQQCPGN
jgi:hypothetical protein